MKAKKFEYIKGAAKTSVPWFRPDPELLNNWKQDFYKIKGIEKYQFWICGGALEKWKSWDTDIMVTGKIGSYKELENILVKATQFGFKYRQLLDISWNDDFCKKYLEKGSCSLRSICCMHYYAHGWCDLENCLKPEPFVKSITIARKITKNGNTMGNSPYVTKRLGKSLWEREIPRLSKKQILVHENNNNIIINLFILSMLGGVGSN